MRYINIYTIMEGENISAYYNIVNKNIVFIKIQYFFKINKKVNGLSNNIRHLHEREDEK